LKPRRLVLRACAAASLLARAESARQDELRLLIDLLSDEADLTVMSGGRVVFLRTTRLGGDPPQPQVLIGEVRRTMAAVQNQLGGRKVDSIVLCGHGAQQAEMARRIEKELAVPIELFDPFQALKLGEELRSAPPEHPGRFAPLIGLLLAELEHTGHAVDFLHPRRRQEQPPKWKRYIFPAVAVAALIGLYFGYHRMEYARLTKEVQELTEQSKSLDIAIEKAANVQKMADAIEKWTATDICWLDELEEVSREFPPAGDAMLVHLVLGQGPNSKGGSMTMEGLAKSPATIETMEQGLSDPTHQIDSHGSNVDDTIKPYSWRFNELLIINTVPANTNKVLPPAKRGK